MSWFTELTSRAEEMLNKIDENAAVILSNTKTQKKDFTSVNLSSVSDDGLMTRDNSDSEKCTAINTPLICKTNLDIKRRTYVSDANAASEVEKTSNSSKPILKNHALRKDDDSMRVEVLQNEIQSLTREMSFLMHRARISEQEACDLKSQLEIVRHQNEMLRDQASTLLAEKGVSDSTEANASHSFTYNGTDFTECEHKGIDNKVVSSSDISNSKQSFNIRNVEESGTNSNLDNKDTRIQALIKSVSDKQSALELMAAEKSALEFQLDLLRRKHYELLNLKNTVSSFNINDTDDAKAQLPNFMRESPFDTGVARRVKKAYSCIDSFSIRAGMFLRRYPLFRISAFFYVLLMHVWVLLVLFSYMPENKP